MRLAICLPVDGRNAERKERDHCGTPKFPPTSAKGGSRPDERRVYAAAAVSFGHGITSMASTEGLKAFLLRVYSDHLHKDCGKASSESLEGFCRGCSHRGLRKEGQGETLLHKRTDADISRLRQRISSVP